MTEKYYTPSINEFHVGFECEIKVINGNEISWRRQVLRPQDVGAAITKMRVPKMDGPQIRVKYLDEEDIKDLGFSLKYSDKDGRTFNCYAKSIQESTNPYFETLRFNELQIKYYYNWDNLLSLIYVGNGAYKDVFDGEVKNKSELKQMLKRIGYENN